MHAHGPEELQRIYALRFGPKRAYREVVWKTLVEEYFCRHVPTAAHLLDLGFGYGEFLRHVSAAKKYGMDLNPDSARHAPPDTEVILQDCSLPWPVGPQSLDVVFTSNFFEHLPSKAALGDTLGEIARALKPGGTLIAMGPNVARVPGHYWHFWDHHLPLTNLSLGERLRHHGFEIKTSLAAFLPYTMENRPEVSPWLIRLYLRLPLLWPWFGQQFLVIAGMPAKSV